MTAPTRAPGALPEHVRTWPTWFAAEAGRLGPERGTAAAAATAR